MIIWIEIILIPSNIMSAIDGNEQELLEDIRQSIGKILDDQT